MNTSDNCQNCDSKDKVTIAGKTFCANCGSVAQDRATQNTTPIFAALPTVPSIPKSTGGITSSALNANTANSDLVTSLTTSLSQNTEDTNTTQPTPANTAPVPASKPPVDSQSVNQPSIDSVTRPIQVSSIKKFAQAPTQVEPSSQVVPTQPTTDIVKPPQPLDLSISSANTSVAQIPATITTDPQTRKPENLGSELTSLSSKDEDVFSDAQFHELSQTSNERPIDIDNLSQKPTPQPLQPEVNSDITPQNAVIPQVGVSSATSQQKTTTVPMSDIRPQQVPAVAPIQSQMMSPAPTSVVQPNPQFAMQPAAQPSPAVAAMIDQGQINTVTPKEKKLAKKGAKVGTVALTAVGLLLLGAYVWQVNYPNLALKVASGKAGINATVPNYLPNGWQISGNINSSPGLVSYQLNSKDGKKATINESKTDWDSQALAENYVNNQSDKYLALQAAGLTIYVYNNQASWVNNGTWYRIEGTDTGLSQDQLIRMATSL